METISRSAPAAKALLLLLASASAQAGPVADHCEKCHGKDGISADSGMPSIAGFSKEYLVETMQAYREKSRPCAKVSPPSKPKDPAEDMCKIASNLSESDIESVAEVYTAKPYKPARQKFDAAKAATGKKVHEAHCEKCHSENGSVADDDAGILAGQQMGYLRATLKDFREGKRPQEKKMKEKMDKLGEVELEALTHYYGSLQ
jgi:sulfide dehydrogenase cytochrome subunit